MPGIPGLLDKLLKEKPKAPPEVVAKLLAAFESLQHGKTDKILEQITKYLQFAKMLLFGDDEREATKENALALAIEATNTTLLARLIKGMYELDFEARKDVASVYGAIVRIKEKDGEDRAPGADYMQAHPELLESLFDGYDSPVVALNCGPMLRDTIRHEQLAKHMLDSRLFLRLFDKVEVANFEVASDAFSTFKDLLTRHKAIVAVYLQEHYVEFFQHYQKLLQSANYVVRRQSLKLLGELLLDRSNVKVMVKYVGEVMHLMTMMVLLKDQSRQIQFEAFHVFKVFVANPNKPQPIVDILTNNRDKLLKYLEDFHTEKEEDEQFKEEKAVIIKTIAALAGPAPASAVGPPPAADEQQQQQQEPPQPPPQPQAE